MNPGSGRSDDDPIVIIGAGKIGRAILGYREFAKINIHVTAFFRPQAGAAEPPHRWNSGVPHG